MKKLVLIFYLFVLLMFLLVEFVITPAFDNLADEYFQPQISEYNRELVKGTFALMQQDLLHLPVAQWENHIQAIQPSFGYPIELKGIVELDLTPEEREQINVGQILVRGGGKLFLQRLGNENLTLAVGPFPVFEVGKYQVMIPWAFMLMLTIVFTILWVSPFWNKLKKIIATAAAFGNGNLGHRVRISKYSSLHPLAEAFNKMADRIQQLISAQQDLTSAVSHELRTPIARLRFGLEMYESSTETKAKAKYFAGMNKDIDELDDLVSEILTYARLNRAMPNPQLQEQSIVPWLQQVVAASLDHLATEQTHIQCITKPLSNELKIHFDARLMERAVLNLLQNAIRYGNGRIQIVLELTNGSCLIHIDDDGPGIPEADRQRIFEPFTRLESSRSKATGGFGLGLAIVKGVATSHQGTINITDSPLGGCRVTLQWPVQ